MRSATIPQCVVLAGGQASRLGPLAATTPKPALEVGGRPFLYWLMREMLRFGVERFLFLAGHLARSLEAAVREASAALPRSVEIAVVVEPAPAGTGGALLHAAPQLEDRFLLVNGDSLLDANLARLLADSAKDGADALGRLLLARVKNAARYGTVMLDGARVLAFSERPARATAASETTDISAGIYAFDRRLLCHLAPICSLERDILPVLAGRGLLRATLAEGWFIDIGVPDDLTRARAELPARLRRKALLLDRDGVLNQDHGYVGNRARWVWTEGAQTALRRATELGWHVFVVTNQSGVARGFYTEQELRDLHAWVADAARQAGGTIDDWRYCPFHPEAPLAAYRRASDWRKPGAGMVRDLIRAWDLTPETCVLVGDQPSDLAAAAAAGIRGVLFPGGDLGAFLEPLLTGFQDFR